MPGVTLEKMNEYKYRIWKHRLGMGQYMGHGASRVVQGNIRIPTFIDIGV